MAERARQKEMKRERRGGREREREREKEREREREKESNSFQSIQHTSKETFKKELQQKKVKETCTHK